jgi:DNA-directed RNA polymerase beta' subunit
MIERMSNGDQLDFGNVKQFKLPTIKRYFEKYDVPIKSEKLSKVNLNKLARERIAEGKDFLVTNPMSVKKDGTKTEDGIFSLKFGLTQFDDNLGTRDMYRCRCGKLSGAIYLDEICTDCKVKVEFIDVDLTIMGWIHIGDEYMVMNPAMFIHMQDLIGKAELDNIIRVDISKMTSDGNIKVERTPKSPFIHIGMINLALNLDEILDFYLKKYSRKREIYELLKENQDCIFTSYIPVYSSILRPRIESNEKIRSFKANTIYDTIMKQYELIELEVGNMISILPALYEIQNEYMELYNNIVETYVGKEGLLRAQFGGIRVDYGARSVIINGKHLKPDEVEIPYVSAITFLELEILYLLRILDDITENEAYQILNKAMREFNPKIYSLVMSIINNSKTPISVLLNRPPSLSDRSIRLLRVSGVKTDINDLTISISPSLLDGFAGDYDGDSLAYIPLKDWRLIKTFEQTLSPRFNYISRTTGKYSPRMGYIKDYIIILSELYALADMEK